MRVSVILLCCLAIRITEFNLGGNPIAPKTCPIELESICKWEPPAQPENFTARSDTAMVGVVEGDGLTDFLLDDRPNFGYRSHGSIIDRAAEVSAIAIGHGRCCAVHSYFCDFCDIKFFSLNLV